MSYAERTQNFHSDDDPRRLCNMSALGRGSAKNLETPRPLKVRQTVPQQVYEVQSGECRSIDAPGNFNHFCCSRGFSGWTHPTDWECGLHNGRRDEWRGVDEHPAAQSADSRAPAGVSVQGHVGPRLCHVPERIAGRTIEHNDAPESARVGWAEGQVVAQFRRLTDILQTQGEQCRGECAREKTFFGKNKINILNFVLFSSPSRTQNCWAPPPRRPSRWQPVVLVVLCQQPQPHRWQQLAWVRMRSLGTLENSPSRLRFPARITQRMRLLFGMRTQEKVRNGCEGRLVVLILWFTGWREGRE